MSAERPCYLCADPAKETRPYGAGGRPICFTCMKAQPEREQEAMRQLLATVTDLGYEAAAAILLDGERGPVPLDPAKDN